MEVINMSATAMTFQQSTLQDSTVNELTTRSKILIGGLGALTPIILNLLVVDLNTTFATVTALVVLAYLIRVGVLFCIGGAMAYFHKNEKNALKLFEIGIVAPALLTALMNGTTNIKDPNVTVGTDAPAVSASVTDFFIPTVYAQTSEPEIKGYSRIEDSVASQLWQGLSGTRNERVWFVVAGTFKTSEIQKARGLVDRIGQSSPAYKPQIYKNDEYYAVVIGANLTLAQAKARKEKAYEAKVPTAYGDIYLYNPWDSK
jgi:hypothetical protein